MRPLWITWILLAALWLCPAPGSVHGYDGYSACPKTYRSVRHRAQLPCDFQQQSWCTVPGSAYPWHAVRRFVHENHGLMRRMYGDERHISVLRAEIESNDVELVRDPGWHLEDDVKRRYSAKPHFRPANRNHHQQHAPPQLQQQPPPPPTSVPPEPSTSAAPSSTSVLTTTTTTAVPSTTTSATTPSTTSTSTTTASPATTTTSSTTSTGSPQASSPADTPQESEPLGLYNGRVHPHIFNASGLGSTSSRSPASSSSTTASSTTSTSATSTASSDTTEDDWVTEETTLATLTSSASPSASPSTTTSTQATSTSTEREELADVEDNVADEPDGEADGDAASAAQETLFQDADSGPGPDAAQQPGKPATPLIKLRGVNACPVKEEVVAPFWANNTRGEVLALLNLYPFEQYVHWEKCTHEHKQMFCREGCRCEQQYRLHRLLAYDPNNECRGIFSDWFKFPSCCICRCYDLPAEFRFTSRSPRTPALRVDPGPSPGSASYSQRRPRPNPHAVPVKDWYRLQAGGGGGGGR